MTLAADHAAPRARRRGARAAAQTRTLAEHGAVLDHAVARRSASRCGRPRPRRSRDPSPTWRRRGSPPRARRVTSSPTRGVGGYVRAGGDSAAQRGTDRGRAARGLERALELLEHADDAQPAGAVRARPRAGADALDEVLALDPQRLGVGDPRREDVAAARDVLAVAARVLVEALVVDRSACPRAPCRRRSPSVASRRP